MQSKTRWIGFLAPAILLFSAELFAQPGAQARVILPAQPATSAQPVAPQSPDLTGLANVAFRVSDLDKEVNFFGKLGFEEAFTHLENGHMLQVFIKVNDQQFIEVYPQSDQPQALGFMHASYESANLNALRARYLAAGLHPTPVGTDADGNLMFTLLDPDSRVTEFTQYMPDSRHMKDRGQHLGDSRLSDTLLGFELPVTNLDTAGRFYGAIGFDVEKDGPNYRLSIPANPDLRIELHSQRVNDQPQFLFTVEDARGAYEQLRHAGLKPDRENNLVFVRDPDGNAFVLLQTGTSRSPKHLIPHWH